MTRFYGKIGFGHSVEKAKGVWVDEITERVYRGDVVRASRRLEDGSYLHKDVVLGNTITIVADPYTLDNLFAIRYAFWMNTRWTVNNVILVSPRIQLILGEVYNGPTPA